MKIRTVYAGTVAALDSNVFTGGGTDDTAALQQVLDLAVTEGGVRLVMDGAALVRGLVVHSNTTIECLTKDCGFYLADGSDCSLLMNADRDKKVIRNRCITLIGGTYNHNAAHQRHDAPTDDPTLRFGTPGDIDHFGGNQLVMAMQFYGVEYLTIRDVTVRNQRAWTACICNWRNVVIENFDIDLPDHINGANQDGLHFVGPGRFLSIRNLRGRTGDDLLALGSDEFGGGTSIEDVEADGIFCDGADQCVRLLSRASGRLDRVTIRNVSGTYKSFGFYINPWFDGAYGSFGNIVIENVDLRQSEPNYHYTNPFLFRIGGNIECLTLKNVRCHLPSDDRPLAEIGIPFVSTKANLARAAGQHIGTVIFDGLTVLEDASVPADSARIRVVGHMDSLMLRGVTAIRAGGEPSGALIGFGTNGSADRLFADSVFCSGYAAFVDSADRIGTYRTDGVVCEGVE